MTRTDKLESLIRQLQNAACRSEKIAAHPHIQVSSVESVGARQYPSHSYMYLAVSEDVALSHNNNAALMHEVATFLKTVNESEQQMQTRILREFADYLQGNKNGKGL